MGYIPNTPQEQQAMLERLGLQSLEDLLEPVPEEVRLRRPLNLPPALAEPDLKRLMTGMAARNKSLDRVISFLGAGTYEHAIPSVVPHLQRRSEFVTSYTPYQPEVSQGMLQAIYEFQTMVCQLTGLDIANASLYDGATALVEAVFMALGPGGQGEVVVSAGVDPQYRRVLRTYARARGFRVREIATENGVTSLAALEAAVGPETVAVAIQQPNFFGCIEDVKAIEPLVHRQSRTVFISVTSEPASFGLLASPAEYKADIAVGELMSFGNPMSFGGPALGFLAARERFLRLMPGRLVGQTVEEGGAKQTGYVLTLQAREQHIRRERATSNICTNQSLLAVGATIYMAALGKEGLRELAALCLHKAHYAQRQISALPGFDAAFSNPFFDEFVIRLPISASRLQEHLLQYDIIGGYDLGRDYPDLADHMLFCVTEMRTRDDIDRLVAALKEVAA
ncbi:putative glycine dehydrogenase (decarboxylating) subunit 1 [Thermogemmatispora aurantia]|jgi:glycine dehydrogenase subunit 1|uniref:Probable glycine dehydrogenase (decarboxylating) subunit 1 n=1 Tax=Thermogemmatispora aurantia TaxID=2045279 RepID=A0A5J4KB26_9CHLR|nr:aminomethyl-transferring glycine dehydrogenase subunit GcvPA [Thermogemmatispora aurantia]GER85784.1 putative glycine dehydrogenase (decarboxylating) subunit 1 [Thermogemmatispora aurantia]